MKNRVVITPEVKLFLETQGVINVATCDKNGMPNISPKGPLRVEGKNTVYFLDLYSKKTRRNLLKNSNIALSAIDMINYRGYQLKGTAELIDGGTDFEKHKYMWHEHKNKLLVDRIIRSIQRGIPHDVSEKNLPHPKYLVKVTVAEVIDLVPKK